MIVPGKNTTEGRFSRHFLRSNSKTRACKRLPAKRAEKNFPKGTTTDNHGASSLVLGRKI